MYIPPQLIQGITDDTSFVDEEGIREYLNSTSLHRSALSKRLPGRNICRQGRLRAALVGQPDFLAVQIESAVLFLIEVETPVSLPFAAQQDLVTLYNVEKGSLVKSSVDQIYSYMAANSLLYGMLTFAGAMWFM